MRPRRDRGGAPDRAALDELRFLREVDRRADVARHTASAHVGYAFVRTEPLLVTVSLGAALSVVRVRAHASDAAFSAQSGLGTAAGAVGDLSVRYLPKKLGGRFGGSLSAGLEVLPAAPALGFEDNRRGRFVTRERYASFLPFVALDVCMRFR